jgi:hypothetical protein
MKKRVLPASIAWLAVIVFIINLAAMKFFWYYSISWFDMFMHSLGGFWLGLFFFWLIPVRIVSLKFILQAMGGVLLVGIFWEIFELFTQQYIAGNPFSLPDTISDLFFDLAGGFLALIYSFRKVSPASGNKV